MPRGWGSIDQGEDHGEGEGESEGEGEGEGSRVWRTQRGEQARLEEPLRLRPEVARVLSA